MILTETVQAIPDRKAQTTGRRASRENPLCRPRRSVWKASEIPYEIQELNVENLRHTGSPSGAEKTDPD